MFDTGAVNQALQSNGGAAFRRDFDKGFGLSGTTTAAPSLPIANINDGNTGTFSDDPTATAPRTAAP